MRNTLRWIAMLLLAITVLGSLAIPGRVSLALKILGPLMAVVFLWWVYRGDNSEDPE